MIPIEVVKALYASAYIGHSNCCVGKPAPVIEKRYQRITNPKPGDMVIEISSGPRVWKKKEELRDCIGWLIAVESMFRIGENGKQELWNTYYHICTLDGKVITWENCRFVTVPTHWQWPEES